MAAVTPFITSAEVRGSVEYKAFAAEIMPVRMWVSGLPAQGICEVRRYNDGSSSTFWFPDDHARVRAWSGVLDRPGLVEMSLFRPVSAGD